MLHLVAELSVVNYPNFIFYVLVKQQRDCNFRVSLCSFPEVPRRRQLQIERQEESGSRHRVYHLRRNPH